MATIATLQEISDWYQIFNTVINKYGGEEISEIAPPMNSSVISTEHINNLYNTIDAFKEDEYLSTEPQLYASDYSIINSGTKLIRSTQAIPIETTIEGIKQIKCRNKATYNNSNNNQGEKSSGNCSSGTKSNGSDSSGTKENGTCDNGTRWATCSYNANSSGYYGLGGCSSGKKSNWYYSNGNCNYETHSNDKNSHNKYDNGSYSEGSHSSGTCSSGTCSSGTCSSGTVIDILNANTSTEKE